MLFFEPYNYEPQNNKRRFATTQDSRQVSPYSFSASTNIASPITSNKIHEAIIPLQTLLEEVRQESRENKLFVQELRKKMHLTESDISASDRSPTGHRNDRLRSSEKPLTQPSCVEPFAFEVYDLGEPEKTVDEMLDAIDKAQELGVIQDIQGMHLRESHVHEEAISESNKCPTCLRPNFEQAGTDLSQRPLAPLHTYGESFAFEIYDLEGSVPNSTAEIDLDQIFALEGPVVPAPPVSRTVRNSTSNKENIPVSNIQVSRSTPRIKWTEELEVALIKAAIKFSGYYRWNEVQGKLESKFELEIPKELCKSRFIELGKEGSPHKSVNLYISSLRWPENACKRLNELKSKRLTWRKIATEFNKEGPDFPYTTRDCQKKHQELNRHKP